MANEIGGDKPIEYASGLSSLLSSRLLLLLLIKPEKNGKTREETIEEYNSKYILLRFISLLRLSLTTALLARLGGRGHASGLSSAIRLFDRYHLYIHLYLSLYIYISISLSLSLSVYIYIYILTTIIITIVITTSIVITV